MADERGDYPKFRLCGDTALSVELGPGIARATNRAVHALDRRLRQAALPGVVETVPSFRAVLVHYDPLTTTGAAVEHALTALLADAAPEADRSPPRRFLLPACYEPAFAPDLADVVVRTGLTVTEIVTRHTAQTYSVYMLGTYPGFAFMGDTNPALRLPRRTEPRTSVPEGSVALADQLTAIYPLAAPGGWHVIGRSAVRLFDPQQDPPTLLRAGDEVRFQAVDRAAFETMRTAPPPWVELRA